MGRVEVVLGRGAGNGHVIGGGDDGLQTERVGLGTADRGRHHRVGGVAALWAARRPCLRAGTQLVNRSGDGNRGLRNGDE